MRPRVELLNYYLIEIEGTILLLISRILTNIPSYNAFHLGVVKFEQLNGHLKLAVVCTYSPGFQQLQVLLVKRQSMLIFKSSQEFN